MALIDLSQSISIQEVKSCKGINLNTSCETCIVPLPKNNKTLKKFVSIYFLQFNNSSWLSNGPMTRKVSLHTTPGGATIISGGIIASAE